MTSRPCKSCGRELTFARTPDGKVIPLDMVAPVYELEIDPDSGQAVAIRAPASHVSHFATCPHAARHSRRTAR
jgi:hypothetical protein